MAKRVLVAMSGGVDSGVAAFLLKQQGYECVGCTMKLYQNEAAPASQTHTCGSLDDVEDARGVARSLNIPHHIFDFSDDFREQVIGKFVKSYEIGQTPNPCIDCNRTMKFGKLFDRAAALECDYVATGHYAVIEKENGRFCLKKAADPTKDQSYVLYNMNEFQLSHTLLPLGGLTKTEVRRIAEQNGFLNAHKPDSQDICFVPDGDYAKIVEQYSGKKAIPGDFVDRNGQAIGRHKGIIHYTIGQRKGLGIAAKTPLYVCDICPKNNTVLLGQNEELFSRELTADRVTWIGGVPPCEPFACEVKIRYRQPEQPATVTITGERAFVVFDAPQRAVTPGQTVVFYRDDTVLGGGTIIGKTL